MTARKLTITSEEQAIAVLTEVSRLKDVPAPEFVDDNFPAQAAFIRDPAKRKASKCTRRAGKSLGIGRILYKEAYNFPGCTCVYIALTKATARAIMWKDVMKSLNTQLGLGASFNETTLRVTLPNGSEILLTGMDAGEDEMEKLLGGKMRVAVVDEAGSFRVDLRKLVYENIEPALADLDGYMILGGTPTEYTQGLFFDVTKDEGDREPGWSVHEWDTFQNPYMVKNWTERLERLRETNPRVEETPAYKRMYLGKWVVDTSDLVYKYEDTRNQADALPDQNHVYVLGVDFGFTDASAFALAAYSVVDRSLYFVESYKKSGMTVSDVAERLAYYVKRYNPYKIVVDNAARQTVEELRQRFGFPLEAADKQGKAEFIEIMNSELLQGKIKLVLPQTDELATEWRGLIWDKDAWEKRKRREEHPGCENHLADAALYAWRHCYHYLSRPLVAPVVKSDVEKVDEWEERQAANLHKQKKKAFWERIY